MLIMQIVLKIKNIQPLNNKLNVSIAPLCLKAPNASLRRPIDFYTALLYYILRIIQGFRRQR